MSEPEKTPFLTGRTYDTLKAIALVVLPAIGAAYFGLAQIWGLPNGEEVVGSITILDTFLGALIGASSKAYNNSDAKYDGEIIVSPTGAIQTFSINTDADILDVGEKTLKVVLGEVEKPI